MKKAAALLFLASWVAFITPSSSQEHYASGYIERFICKDGFVIDETWHCDGSDDCPDGSDEENCPMLCDIHQFRCHNSPLCIARWRVCNGKADCPDGSDETQCATPTPVVPSCSESQVLCANNQSCVWSSFLCDGDIDCNDNSDELNCGIPVHGCTDNQFQCDSGWCIPSIYVCDGENDCYVDAQATDELHCGATAPTCGDSFFNCSNGKCVNIHDFCDGADDCSDNSDEENCPSLKCPHKQFSCLVGGIPTCIPKTWVCDGEGDCDNAEDEYECDGGCPSSHFQCTSTTQCITMDKKCDGVHNCNDSSDEYICPFAPPPGYCEEDQILCLDGVSCVEATRICDNNADCMDSSDEDDFCRGNASSCADNNGGCEHNCHTHSGNRAVCSCRLGYQLNSTDLKSCHDYDECSHPDSCVQLCTNSEGSFSCSCAPGYHLTESGDCKAIGPKAHLVFANRVDIRSVGLDGRMRHLLVKHLKYAADIDYHYELGYLYWVDLNSDKIMRADLEDGYNVTAIINSSLEGPNGLAVDWVNDKLYWTDIETGLIEVSELDGRHRKRLFSVNLEKPRAIVLDPHSRLLFWTDWGSQPKIERASMDGGGRAVVHSEHLIWPNALTLDLPTKTMYWADAKLHIIETSDYFGRNRRPVVTTGIFHPFAMTTFENRLFWSDWYSLSILSARKNLGRNMTLLDNSMILEEHLTQNTSNVHKDLFYPMGLRVVQPALQPPYVGENPCDRASSTGSGCQFLCLLSSEREEGYSCACPTGTEIGPNGTECNAINRFLVYSQRGGIHLVTLEDVEAADISLPVTNVNGPVGIDIDPITKVLYWTDIFKDEISSLNLDGFKQKTIASTDLVTPAGIAVDWIGRKLYWTNDLHTRDAIEVSELDGSNRIILFTRGVEKPRDIVVHPTAGLLFWTELSEARPLIGRANLDGSERIIIADTGLRLPNGLAVDYELNRLYWCDAKTHLIEYSNFDGSNRTVLVSRVIHPFGLTIYGNQLYWTDWVQGSIEVVNKETGAGVRSFIRNIEGVTDLHAFSGNQLEGVSHPCSVDNGGCSHLCLSRPSLTEPGQLQASCACPDGRTVMEGGKICFKEIQQSLIFPTSNRLVQLSLDNTIFAPTPLAVRGFQTASYADVDIIHDIIYWTNKLEGKIYRSPLSGGGVRTPVISLDLVNPEALVVDWIGQYLYWADSGTGSIEVAALNGTNRKLLLSGGFTQVTSLALDLESHSLYWVDTGDREAGKPPKIETSAMDGSGRRSVVSDMSGLPRSIAVHHPPGTTGGRIYWTDELNGVIESATLTGSDRTVVAVLNESTSGAPYGISVNSDFIYWTDIVDHAIYRIPLELGETAGRRRREATETGLYLVLNSSDALGPLTLVQKDYTRLNTSVFSHPCNSSPCSHLCLPNWSTRGYSCHCPTGLKMRTQNTCWNIPRKFAFAGSVYNLYRILHSSPNAGIKQTVEGNVWGPVAMDHILYSSDSGRLFFSDQFRSVISSINLDGSDLVDILTVGVVVGVAVNWVDKYIYWTDTTYKRVEVARLDGTGRKVLYQYPSSDFNGTSLRGMALHPRRGVMFWTNWGVREPSIMRARMDGSFVSPAVDIDIVWPNAVTIDQETDTIYWVDAYYHHIESSDMNGKDRRVVLRNGVGPYFILYHGFDVLVKNGFVYWSEWYQNSLYEALLPTGSDRSGNPLNLSVVSRVDDRYFGFTVIDTDAPRRGELTGGDSTSACGFRNGGCGPAYLCLPINHRERLCACPDNTTDCTEYYGYKGQLPPPSVLEKMVTTTSFRVTTPTSNKRTAVTTVATSPATTRDGGSGGDGSGGSGGKVRVATDLFSASQAPSQFIHTSMPERLIIVITLIVMIFVVMVSLTTIVSVTLCYMRKQKKLNVYVTSTQRKQFSNPIYVSMNANRREPSQSSSSSSIPPTPSREEGFSFLPKLNNAKVIQDTQPSQQDRARKTNSNIFIEEPDVFIMPGQSTRAPRREWSPEIIPFKPPLPVPQDDDEFIKPLPPPPPIPPKTYIKVKCDGNAELTPRKSNITDPSTLEAKVPAVTVSLEPKQSNIDHVRAVTFHSDVKVPRENDPPPLPSRKCRESNGMGVVSRCGLSRPLSGMSEDSCSSSFPEAQVTAERNHSSDVIDPGIAIVTKDGTKIGEVVSNPDSCVMPDYDRLLPMQAPCSTSNYDRLMPSQSPTDHIQLSDNPHAESQC